MYVCFFFRLTQMRFAKPVQIFLPKFRLQLAFEFETENLTYPLIKTLHLP